MRIIISPAKKMNVDRDSFAPEGLPRFLEQTERLKTALRGMSPRELQALWKCSDAIAALNAERLRDMELRRGLTPAVMSYEGIQYQYMAPGVLEQEPLDYLRAHLRILSGFYGLLRPFDGVTPYRLEMQAALAVDGHRDLYAFWGGRLAEALAAETDLVLNLASREYSLCVSRYIPANARMITCLFGQWKEGRVVEKGTACKMARGEMVRFLAQRQAETAEEARAFDRLGYRYAPEHSDETTYCFIKEES